MGEQTRIHFYKRMIQLRAEIRSVFADTAHWNWLHPTETIDPDPDGELSKLAERLDRSIERERTIINQPSPSGERGGG